MKRTTSAILAGALAAAISASSVMAQDSTIHSRSNLSVVSSANMEKIPPKTGLSEADKKFMVSMARVNQSEILIGQLAQKQGGDWAKAYGKDMEREHTLALEELKKMATNYGVGLPHDVDPMTTKAMKWLEKLQGTKFDDTYKNMMINGHSMVLDVIQKEMRGGHNSDVRSYAVTMEPAVKLHLKMAQQQTTMTGSRMG